VTETQKKLRIPVSAHVGLKSGHKTYSVSRNDLLINNYLIIRLVLWPDDRQINIFLNLHCCPAYLLCDSVTYLWSRDCVLQRKRRRCWPIYAEWSAPSHRRYNSLCRCRTNRNRLEHHYYCAACIYTLIQCHICAYAAFSETIVTDRASV